MIGSCGYNGEGQQWRRCNVSGFNSIDNTAKRLEEFSSCLLYGRQVHMPGQGRSVRRCCKDLWSIWLLSPLVD